MRDDQLAAGYLMRLRRAAQTMPRARRRELPDEIAAHAAEERAAGVVPPQRVPDDLGDPKDIAGAGSARSRLGVREIAAVVLLLIGGFIFVAGWVAGLILLWASPRWRWPDKLLGTLVWPFGYAGLLYAEMAVAFTLADSNATPGACPGGVCPPVVPTWLGVLIEVVALGAPIAVAIWLMLRARRVPDQTERLISGPDLVADHGAGRLPPGETTGGEPADITAGLPAAVTRQARRARPVPPVTRTGDVTSSSSRPGPVTDMTRRGEKV